VNPGGMTCLQRHIRWLYSCHQ